MADMSCEMDVIRFNDQSISGPQHLSLDLVGE